MRSAVLLLVLAAACSDSPAPNPVGKELSFRTLTATRNVFPCVAGPEFRIADDDEDWIDLYDAHTACTGSGEIRLPRVRFPDEIVVAAWWGIDECPGRDVDVRSVTFTGTEIVVSAETTQPRDACVGSIGLQSLLAVQRQDGSVSVRFVLDGRTTGTAAAAPTAAPGGS